MHCPSDGDVKLAVLLMLMFAGNKDITVLLKSQQMCVGTEAKLPGLRSGV